MNVTRKSTLFLFDSISTLYTCCVCQLFVLEELDDDQHPDRRLQRQRHFEQCRRTFFTELLPSLLHLTSRKTCFVVYLDQQPFYMFKIVGLTSQNLSLATADHYRSFQVWWKLRCSTNGVPARLFLGNFVLQHGFVQPPGTTNDILFDFHAMLSRHICFTLLHCQ